MIRVAEANRAGAWFLMILLSLAVLAGCRRTPSQAPVAKPVVPAGPCSVVGSVRYLGPAVVPKVIGGDYCPGTPPVVDQSAVVGPDGGLANVVVFIEDGPNVAPVEAADAVLTQIDCTYSPHVMAVRAGRRILVTSHDPTMHNVHIQSAQNPPDNFAENQGASHAVTFNVPGLVRFKCDVHPWMSAFVRVFEHPCFAVTGPDGSFKIDRLPPGTYKLVAWHERFGELSQTVVVKDAAGVKVPEFDYKP